MINHPLNQFFVREQLIKKPISEVFKFFSDAKNLERITPPSLSFHIVKMSTQEISEGTLIDYQLKLYGIPLSWKSKIEEWKFNSQFVDTQITGPYAFWHHTHSFEDLNGYTRMLDKVVYRVPMGAIGKFLVGSFIRNDLNKIFDYRYQLVNEMFNQ